MNTAPTLGVITTDRHLAIRGWNEWMASATGVAEASAIGRSLLDFVVPERAGFYRELFDEVLERGTARVLAPAFHRYLIACAPRGSSTHFSHMRQRVTVAPLAADAGIVGVMITIEDVTERLDGELEAAAALQRTPGTGAASPETALASEDWRVRNAAVRHLQRSATVDDIRHLFAALQRDHHDFNILNSALRVLIAAGHPVVEPLMQMLSDREANLRMQAALALGELQAHEATPPLVRALDDPDENVRFHAIEALGRIGDAESVDPLAKIAASDNFFLAFAAIDALSKTEDARVAPLMVSLLDQELLRPAAIETLAAIGDEDCVPALARVLNEDAAHVGPVAAALTRIHERYEHGLGDGSVIVDAVRRAMTATGRDRLAAAVARDDAHRGAVATVLGWVGRDALEPLMNLVGDQAMSRTVVDSVVEIGADAVAPLLTRLDAPAPATRAAAADLLGRLGDRRAAPALIGALDDADASVAAAAAAALGNIGAPAAMEPLFSLFAHDSSSVRRAAVGAVTAIGAPATAARVRSALADANPLTRECAVRVAGYFGYDECVPAIVAALRDSDEDVRRAAIDQLPVLDNIDAADRLHAALTSETPRNRAAAAHALRLLDDPRAGQSLQSALQDADPWVRYYAASSLGEARFGSAAADDLAALARLDPAPHVRIAAVTALGAMHGVLGTRVAAELMTDEDDDLAIAAVGVLGAQHRHDAHEWLTNAARSPRPAVRLAAIRAIATRPTPASVELLSWAARLDDDPAAPSDAIDALCRIAASDQPVAQRAAVGALRELATEGTQRRDVLAAMARLPEAAVPEVASGLSAMRVATRVATADALAAMRHPRASSELSRALRDEDPAVRSAAVAGFAKLGTPAVARIIAAMRHSDPDAGVRHRAELACVRHGWSGAAAPRS